MYRSSAIRIARAGETPTLDAALVKPVVLNGAGGLRVLRLDSTERTSQMGADR